MEALGNWQQRILHERIAKFSPDDVFNADARPRGFKNAKVPVKYIANNKAWMTGNFFRMWLQEWDCKLQTVGRKILLFINNCPSHFPKTVLQQITLQSFPPNTTADSQPMDKVILENMKVHYRHYLLRERISAINKSTVFKYSLLKTPYFPRRAWESLKPETIKKGFFKAGFLVNELPEEQLTDNRRVHEELEILSAELKDNGVMEPEATLPDYIASDQYLTTTGSFMLAENAEAP